MPVSLVTASLRPSCRTFRSAASAARILCSRLHRPSSPAARRAGVRCNASMTPPEFPEGPAPPEVPGTNHPPLEVPSIDTPPEFDVPPGVDVPMPGTPPEPSPCPELPGPAIPSPPTPEVPNVPPNPDVTPPPTPEVDPPRPLPEVEPPGAAPVPPPIM